jgi:hypothetical protein
VDLLGGGTGFLWVLLACAALLEIGDGLKILGEKACKGENDGVDTVRWGACAIGFPHNWGYSEVFGVRICKIMLYYHRGTLEASIKAHK